MSDPVSVSDRPSFRDRLRRHRWNLVIAAGLVIGLWIAPYCYFRQTNPTTAVVHGKTYRFLVLPESVPTWYLDAFRPLASADTLFTGQEIIMEKEILIGGRSF